MSEAREQGAPPPYDWKGALRVLEGEEPPPKLREALAALAVHGRRLRCAVRAYGARVARSMADPAERDLPLRLCHEWPEWVERAAALASYYAAKREVAEQARAWAEGFEAPADPLCPTAECRGACSPEAHGGIPDSGPGVSASPVALSAGARLLADVADALEARVPGPCAALREQAMAAPTCSLTEAREFIHARIGAPSLRHLPPCLAARAERQMGGNP